MMSRYTIDSKQLNQWNHWVVTLFTNFGGREMSRLWLHYSARHRVIVWRIRGGWSRRRLIAISRRLRISVSNRRAKSRRVIPLTRPSNRALIRAASSFFLSLSLSSRENFPSRVVT